MKSKITIKLKTEDEIKDMLKRVLEQYQSVGEDNPSARKILENRGVALMWVLGISKQAELTLSKDAVDFWSALW